MKVAGVIPARWGSTRFPGKSLAVLCGKPLIQWVYEQASRAEQLDSLIVATDDERIQTGVTSFGGKTVMTRTDHPSGTDRAAEAIGSAECDVVVNIQGDEPFIEPLLIDQLVEVMRSESQWDMATAAVRTSDITEIRQPSVVKVVVDGENRALYFSRSVIPFDRDGGHTEGEVSYLRHVGIYAYRRHFLERFVKTPPCANEQVERLEQLRALHIGAAIKVVETGCAGVGIDTPEDLESATRQMQEIKKP
jgi:3-deoxy-manno-octulosonate cytidylyltransferase (CMP-KDO synthetase)